MNLRNLLFLLSLLSAAGIATAQPNSHWKEIGQLSLTVNVANRGNISIPAPGTCGYFWNAQHGLVGTIPGIKDAAIFLTTDGGATWTESITPSEGAIYSFSSIYMRDDDTGWASLVSLGPNNSVLWKTTDGGKIWNAVPGYLSSAPPPPPPGYSGSTGSGILDVSMIPATHSLLTLSSYAPFWGFPNTASMAVAWANQQLGMIDEWGASYNSQFLVTQNGGFTWVGVPYPPILEAWGIGGVAKWKAFVIAPEYWLGSNAQPLVTTNNGSSWVASAIHVSWTGDVETGPAVAYAQSMWSDGLYRTTDTGRTWVSIGGPGNRFDTRFCVAGCDGSVVIAFDDSGGVWETTDGGDGLLGRSEPKLSATALSLSARLCAQKAGTITLEGVQCNPFVLDSLAFVDSSLVRLGVLYLDSSPVIPETFDSGRSDLIRFRWNPSAAFTRDTAVQAQVFLRYLDGATGVERDTVISLTLVAQAPAMSVGATPNVDFSTVSTCAYADSIITLVNNSCEPVRIDSLGLYSNDYFILSSDSIIQPGDTAYVTIRFKPAGANTSQAYLTVYLNQLGVHGFVSVNLSGAGVQGFGVLDVRGRSLQAGSLSFCDGDTTLTDTLSNTGCDTLVLSNIRFGGDSAFSLISSPGDSLLLPGASGVFQFQFAPRVKGAQSAMLTFHSRNIVNDAGHDTSVTISGAGLGGTTALSTDTATRDFGALFECESRDTTIMLYNPGCDTLRVDSAAFSNASYSPDTAFPIFILPDSSAPVRLHLTGSTNMAGAVTFYSDANAGPDTVTIPLQAAMLHPATLRLVVSPSDSANGGQTVTCYVILDGQIPSGLITGLHFDITHNDDLLSFLSASGITRTGTGGTPALQVDTFAWKVGLEAPTYADTIGTLSFQVYLTDSSTTPLTLSNISFQAADSLPSDCIASIGDSGSGFTYLYQCGNKTLQQFLLSGKVSYGEQNYPNPFGSETGFQTTIPFQTTGTGTAHIRVMDQTGRIILKDNEAVTYAGTHFFYFTGKELPAGQYYYQIEFPDGVVIVNRTMILVK